MRLLGLLAASLTALTLTLGVAAAQDGTGYRVMRDTWSDADERGYSEFIEAIGRAPIVKMSRRIPPTPVAAPW